MNKNKINCCSICDEQYYIDYNTSSKYIHPALFGMVEREFKAMATPNINEICSYFICNKCREYVEDNMDNIILFLRKNRVFK